MTLRRACLEIAACIALGALVGSLIVAAMRIDTPARKWAREAIELVALNLSDR